MTEATWGTATGEGLRIERVYQAPRERVWAAWTDPARMAAWIGPAGYTGADVRMDPRPGGAYRMCIRSDDGTAEWWFGGVYREVTPPERLVFTFAWDPEGGEPPFETLVRVELEDVDGHTLMRFHQTPFVSDASRESHRDGWEQCFADLGAHLSGA